jgi:XTP/dITP diphosphohydrolase
MQLVLATGNLHKVEELRDLLRESNLEVLSLRDFPNVELPEETGATMQDNARLKAEAVMRATKLPALSDDSGIEVDFLGGAPGVHSARWVSGSDADRTNALLKKLRDVPDEKRGARYRCAICVAFPDSRVLASEAVCEGKIAREGKGENGFGYDPIFEIIEATGLPREYSQLTMAQVSAETKARVSHRARALQLVLPSLTALAAT